ncbi:hypothetical protein [Hasllibacter sp. MH4015]|uniref:hypothetical protein n=1 Tax=Hasllibacter sp. MH4015 TaxID=2854029 RepID=UPI001CD69780|nr:hypothetical protein [Hasllibacter sp. MH4015]
MADTTNEVRFLSAVELTEEITDHNGIQTTLKLFQCGVFHVYKLGGPTGKTKLTEERSAKIRYRLCSLLRSRGMTIAQAGGQIATVCGDEDVVITTFLENGEDDDDIYDALKAEIAKL